MENAYWLIPKKRLAKRHKSQSQLHSVGTTHIDYVIDNVELFGLDMSYIVDKYNEYGEKLRFEGKARYDIINGLLDKRFIRLRYDDKSNTWKINIGDIDLRPKTNQKLKHYNRYGISFEFGEKLKLINIWFEKYGSELDRLNSNILILSTNGNYKKFRFGEFEEYLNSYIDIKFKSNRPNCKTCKYGTWAVGIGLGHFCRNESKMNEEGEKVKDINTEFKRFMIPSIDYSCKYFELK